MTTKYHVESNEPAKMSFVMDLGRFTHCITDGDGHRERADIIADLLNVGQRTICLQLKIPGANAEITIGIHPDPKAMPTIAYQCECKSEIEVKYYGYGESADMVVRDIPPPAK